MGLGAQNFGYDQDESAYTAFQDQQYHQAQSQAYQQQTYEQQEQQQAYDQGFDQNNSEEQEIAMPVYAGGRTAQLGQQFRYQAFVSGYHFGFGLDDVAPTSNFASALSCERFVHPIPYGPEETMSAPLPHRAGTSFIDGLAMSVRDTSSPDLLRRPSRAEKPKFFANCSEYNFNSLSPDLSTIVEKSPDECGFPDDPGQLCIDVDTEVFARPGKPVRGGGDREQAVVKKLVGAVTLTFIFVVTPFPSHRCS